MARYPKRRPIIEERSVMAMELVPLDGEARNALASLAYNAWSSAFDTLKIVKAETNDGSLDWADLHAARLTNHTNELASAKRVLDQIAHWSPIILGR